MSQLQYDTEWRRWFHENLTLTSCDAARGWPESGENPAMNIQLNGQERQAAPQTTIAMLLAAEGFAERRVAVEVNGTIIPRGQHAAHAVHEGDRIEIVHALGGG
jgi:sulfur carrier protein